jgi:ABC-type transporter Mla maintaining outer membrane lipid asymmetry ATPase subunit MlaF/ABC-type transporter Mla maintaining outer membrane lipid asymmetry permease subunit MlaE
MELPTDHSDGCDGGATVSLRDLTLSVGSRVLLDRVTAEFPSGSVSLIVGPSGAGKSVLLRLLAGLVTPHDARFQVSGTVRVGARCPWDGGAARPTVGVVFQHFALFDELSPIDNVRFGQAHRARRDGSRPPDTIGVKELLDELDLPCHQRTSHLSGGQKQRLALARTLAYDPDVILYDEPTSGLDIATAQRVGQLIRQTHSRFPTTSIVVTHDYDVLPAIADHVLLLNPATRTLQLVPAEDWSRLPQMLQELAAPTDSTKSETRPAWWRTPLKWATAALGGTGQILERLAIFPLRWLPLWKNVPWGFRYFLHYLRLVAGPTAWLYVAIAGMIIGFVATYFTFEHMPFRQIAEPLVIEELLQALGFALYRILVPVLVTILVAARCGAAVAADVGGKVHGQQIDALKTYGVRPDSYLLTGVAYAFLIGSPLLNLLGFAVARWTSLIVFTNMRPDLGPYFWETNFGRQLSVPGSFLYQGTEWLLAKVLACGLGTGWICYQIALQPKHSATDVSRGVTSGILWATLFVLVVHFAFAFVEF